MVSKKSINYLNNNIRKRKRKIKKNKKRRCNIENSIIYEEKHINENIKECIDMYQYTNEKRNSISSINLNTVLISLLEIKGINVEIFKYFTDIEIITMFNVFPKYIFKIPVLYKLQYPLCSIPITHLNMFESFSIIGWSTYKHFKYYMFENVKHIYFKHSFEDVTEDFLDKFPKLKSITIGPYHLQNIDFVKLRGISLKFIGFKGETISCFYYYEPYGHYI